MIYLELYRYVKLFASYVDKPTEQLVKTWMYSLNNQFINNSAKHNLAFCQYTF